MVHVGSTRVVKNIPWNMMGYEDSQALRWIDSREGTGRQEMGNVMAWNN